MGMIIARTMPRTAKGTPSSEMVPAEETKMELDFLRASCFGPEGPRGKGGAPMTGGETAPIWDGAAMDRGYECRWGAS
jgi:hypothetical protein